MDRAKARTSVHEIKAFVRNGVVDRVLNALVVAEISNIALADVRSIVSVRKEFPRTGSESSDRVEISVTKIEALVQDDDVERVLELIRAVAHTGRLGDGVVYALPVTAAVHIRTGLHGDDVSRG